MGLRGGPFQMTGNHPCNVIGSQFHRLSSQMGVTGGGLNLGMTEQLTDVLRLNPSPLVNKARLMR